MTTTTHFNIICNHCNSNNTVIRFFKIQDDNERLLGNICCLNCKFSSSGRFKPSKKEEFYNG